MQTENRSTHPPIPAFLSTLQFTPMLEAERPFIYKSWLKGYRRAPRVVDMTPDAYFAFQHRQIEKILDTDAQVLMARGLDDPDWLCGFLCSDVVDSHYIVHWCFTKVAYRGMGVLKSLLNTDLQRRGIDPTQPSFSGIYTHQRAPFSEVFDRLQFRYVHM